jgi:hypothetical protein
MVNPFGSGSNKSTPRQPAFKASAKTQSQGGFKNPSSSLIQRNGNNAFNASSKPDAKTPPLAKGIPSKALQPPKAVGGGNPIFGNNNLSKNQVQQGSQNKGFVFPFRQGLDELLK